MESIGFWLLLQRLVSTPLFKLLRVVFTSFQRLWWEINGTADILRLGRDPRSYRRSAQVLKVRMFHKFCWFQNLSFEDFICTHERFTDPQYILDSEDVTLMTFDDEYAIFCESKLKGVKMWSSDCAPFVRQSQIMYHDKLIRVPLSTLHTMAEKLGDPQAMVIFMIHTGRCGSTLVTQLLEATGRCVALCEPDSPSLLSLKYGQLGNTAEMRQLARDIVRLECKPYKSMQPPPLAYVIKLAGSASNALELLHLYPSYPSFFIYRDPVTVSKSMYRMCFPLPSIYLLYKFGSISGKVVEKLIDSMGFSGKIYNHRLENDLTLGVLVYAVATKIYLNLRKKGFPISAIRYEDLVQDPLASCQRILRACSMPEDLAPLAAKGLKKDSQRNSLISKSSIGKIKEPEVTPSVRASIDRMLKKFELPVTGESQVVEGTVTHAD